MSGASRWKRRCARIIRTSQGCVFCGCFELEKLTIDHILARALGGTDKRENLQVLCKECNNKKSAFETKLAAMANGHYRGISLSELPTNLIEQRLIDISHGLANSGLKQKVRDKIEKSARVVMEEAKSRGLPIPDALQKLCRSSDQSNQKSLTDILPENLKTSTG